jgi:hypothetical protein
MKFQFTLVTILAGASLVSAAPQHHKKNTQTAQKVGHGLGKGLDFLGTFATTAAGLRRRNLAQDPASADLAAQSQSGSQMSFSASLRRPRHENPGSEAMKRMPRRLEARHPYFRIGLAGARFNPNYEERSVDIDDSWVARRGYNDEVAIVARQLLEDVVEDVLSRRGIDFAYDDLD